MARNPKLTSILLNIPNELSETVTLKSKELNVTRTSFITAAIMAYLKGDITKQSLILDKMESPQVQAPIDELFKKEEEPVKADLPEAVELAEKDVEVPEELFEGL